MTSTRTLTIISAAIVAAAVIIYIMNGQTADKTELQSQIESNTEKYDQAKVVVNGFEIMADIALTNEQKAKGLAIKDSLNENEGMLFIFQQEGKYGFWMNGMKFPIDIFWLNKAGKVIHIETNLQPCVSKSECPTFNPQENSLYVLETVAGFAEKHGVKIGTDVDFQLIK